jgi:nitrogen fixation protein NifX
MRHLRLVTPTEESSMSVKIAFASSDRRQVDQHFGAAESFAIYELSDGDARLVEVAEFTDRDTAMDGHEGKLAAKIDLLAGCAAVYCNAVGASAIKQLLARDIQPLKVDEGTLIDTLLGELGQSLVGSPPAWMVKQIRRREAGDRFGSMAEEGWEE